jgi:hypothetical protein
MASHPKTPEGRDGETEQPPLSGAVEETAEASSRPPSKSAFSPPVEPMSPELEAEASPALTLVPLPRPPAPPLLLPVEPLPPLLPPVELLAEPVLEPLTPELELVLEPCTPFDDPPELAEPGPTEPLDEPVPLDEPAPGRKHAAKETGGLPLLLLPP